MAKSNILLILTDQQRYDTLGVNGSAVCKTPHTDKLAQEGVNFTNAYSACGLCSPARASIYTGLLPHRHGITRNVMSGDPLHTSISEEFPTLAERLNKEGYHSHFLGKWHAGDRLPTQAGFTGMDVEGYGVAAEVADYKQYLREKGLEEPKTVPLGAGWAHRLTLAGKKTGPVEASIPYYLAERAIEFLKSNRIIDQSGGRKGDRPFFLALNFWGPHAPYLPSEPYASMYDPGDIPPWPNFLDELKGKPPIYRRYRDAFIGENGQLRPWEECAEWAALYYGFTTQIDDQIGRVLSALKELALDEDTAVLFSTDHGDLTGAHGGMHDKDGVLCQEVYHIPLAAKVPGGAAGSVCDAPVSNMDLSRTILDLAGCGYPEELDGKSLLPALMDKSFDFADKWPDYVVSEFFGAHFAYEARLIIHGDYKYVFHPGSFDELYNLKKDPWEMQNLIDSDGEENRRMLRECRYRLIEWAKKTGDELVILCGLFHRRLEGELAPYTPRAMDALRKSETKLL